MTHQTEERSDKRGTTWLFAAATAVLVTAGPTLGQDGGEQPVSGGRQPIITNQFTAATGGAISVRRPGLYVQQGIAVNTGQLDIPGDVPDESPNFFRDTFDLMAMNLLDFISGLLEGVDFLISSLIGTGGSPTPGGAIFIPISNAATTGQGTSVQSP